MSRVVPALRRFLTKFPMAQFPRLQFRMAQFLMAPASPLPLAALRIGLALTLILLASQVSHYLFDLYGNRGILQGPLSQYFSDASIPGIGTLTQFFGAYGLGDSHVLLGLGVVYLFGLAALLVGWHTHVSALVVFLAQWCFGGGQITSYGFDQYAHIALFYLMFMPAGAMFSLDHWQGRASDEPSSSARLSLRVLQLHLSISYFAAGVEKALGSQWWNGDAIWRTLMLPLYRQYDFSWMSHLPWLARLLGWSTLLVEIGYPFFIWPRRTRPLWVMLTVALHVGIGVFMGLTLFGIIMCVLTVCAFGVPDLAKSPIPVPRPVRVPAVVPDR